MDDITIGGPEPLVANDVKHVNTIGATIGLNLNFNECEQINKLNALTSEPISQFSHCTISNATLLGAPFVTGSAMDSALKKKLDELKRASDRLQLIPAHDVLVLLRASCSTPKLMHVMRSSPCTGHTLLSDIDNSLRMTLSIITNVNITDEQWRQASLPVKVTCIGVRSVMFIAPSAFLSSSTSIQQLLLDKCAWQLSDQHFDNVLDDWCHCHYPVQPPTGTNASKQRSWDMSSVDATFNSLFAAQPDDYHRARLTAVKAPHSGDWLNALPITSCGLRLEDNNK